MTLVHFGQQKSRPKWTILISACPVYHTNSYFYTALKVGATCINGILKQKSILLCIITPPNFRYFAEIIKMLYRYQMTTIQKRFIFALIFYHLFPHLSICFEIFRPSHSTYSITVHFTESAFPPFRCCVRTWTAKQTAFHSTGESIRHMRYWIALLFML